MIFLHNKVKTRNLLALQGFLSRLIYSLSTKNGILKGAIKGTESNGKAIWLEGSFRGKDVQLSIDQLKSYLNIHNLFYIAYVTL